MNPIQNLFFTGVENKLWIKYILLNQILFDTIVLLLFKK